MKKHYLDLPQGQIHYIHAGQGEPLLLLHQAPLSSVEWQDVIPLISPYFSVYAPDMVGHGQSYNPDREFFIEDFSATTLQFMDALGIDFAYVAGNHSGAALATSIAVHYPQRVKKMVISCEMLASREHLLGFVEAIKSKPLTRDIPMDKDGQFIADAWCRYSRLSAPGTPFETSYVPFIYGQVARLKPYDIHESVLAWMAKDQWMAKLTCPTLVFGAEFDLFYNEQRLVTIKQQFPYLDSHIIRQAGAFCTFEQPQAIADMLIAYFKPD